MPAVANAFVVARPVPASIAEEDEGALDDAFGQLSKAVDAYPVPAEPEYASPPPTPEKLADRERHFRELLDLTQATLGATHANCISQLRQLAMLLVEEERWEEAEAELRLLVQRSRQCHGDEHDRTLHALSVHAGVLWRLERSDEARASLEELVAAREAEVQQSAWAIADDDASQQLGRAEEALADALTDLASVLFEGGDAKSSIPLLRRARELLAKLYGEGDEQAVACADMLGRALGAEGDVGGATEACRASIRHKDRFPPTQKRTRCPGWSHRSRGLVSRPGSGVTLGGSKLLQPDSRAQKRDKRTIREPASAHSSHSSFSASCGPDRCSFDSFASRLQ